MSAPRDGEVDPLEALQAGDEGPYEALVAREWGRLTAFFGNLGADPGEAEDLTQDVLLKIYDAAASYRPKERFSAYLYRVARNAWIDGRRRAGVRPQLRATGTETQDDRGPDPSDPAPSHEERLMQVEEAERIRAALVHLSPGHRMVFVLGVLQELPYPEVASILEIPLGTVKSRMHYAVERLRRVLSEADPAPTPPRRGGPHGGGAR